MGSVPCRVTASERLTYRIRGSFRGFWDSGSAGTDAHRTAELGGRPELG